MGASDPENPLFLGFSVLRPGQRPWSETMVSEGPDHGVGVDPDTVIQVREQGETYGTPRERRGTAIQQLRIH